MPGRTIKLLCLSVAVGLLSGCLVHIDRYGGGIDRAFTTARAEIDHRLNNPRKAGKKPRSVRIWIFEEGDDAILKVSVPMWMARKAARHALESQEEQDDLATLARYGVSIEDVLSSQRGLLMEVMDDGDRVLIWLD